MTKLCNVTIAGMRLTLSTQLRSATKHQVHLHRGILLLRHPHNPEVGKQGQQLVGQCTKVPMPLVTVLNLHQVATEHRRFSAAFPHSGANLANRQQALSRQLRPLSH